MTPSHALRAAMMTSLLLAGCSHPAAPVRGADPVTVGLAGTRWRLVEFQSMDDAQGRMEPADPDRYTIAFGAEGRAELRLDCNRGAGPWKATRSANGGSLVIGPIATTRMACPAPSMATLLETQLPYVRSYTRSGARLHMALMADGGILTWEAR